MGHIVSASEEGDNHSTLTILGLLPLFRIPQSSNFMRNVPAHSNLLPVHRGHPFNWQSAIVLNQFPFHPHSTKQTIPVHLPRHNLYMHRWPGIPSISPQPSPAKIQKKLFKFHPNWRVSSFSSSDQIIFQWQRNQSSILWSARTTYVFTSHLFNAQLPIA